MKKIFQRLFGKPAVANPPGHDVAGNPDSLSTIEDGSDNAMRRQLILVLLRDLMRRQGMPPAWIELQMLVVSSASRGEGLYVRLTLKHWDARLMNHAQAFQNELLAEIARFEPHFDTWMRGISWQLEMTASCPYTHLPGKAFWEAPAKRPIDQTSTAPVPPTRPAPMPVAAVSLPIPAKVLSESEAAAVDLQLLFQIRDQELSDAAALYAPIDYEKTQPLPLGR